MKQELPFTDTDLKAAAGPLSFERGLGYLSHVADLEIDDGQITATVYGTDEYEVSLTVEVGARSGIVTLYADCSCPFGQEGNFCKHCVAVGLAALRHPDWDRDLLAVWLGALTKEELMAEILEFADEDPGLGRRLALKAALDPARVRTIVQGLLKPGGPVDGDYPDKVYRAADTIDSHIDADSGIDVIGLAREAFGWFKETYARIGNPPAVTADAARELLAVHLRACEEAEPAPDPVDLGTYLADLIVHDNCGVTPSLDEYSDLLGRAGTLAIRDRIKAVYEESPWNPNARHLAESMLKAEGDISALLALYLNEIDALKDASGNDAYQELARLLASVRECHEALGTTGQFGHYVTQLRGELKRKRNLMKLLDERGL